MANYSFKTTGLPEPVNGVVEGHNFTQGAPHTKIYENVSGLRFVGCNLLNCDVPADAIVINCLRCHVSFCSNIHPEWLRAGYITACASDCHHRTVVDTILVDGVAVDTNSTYEDKAVS